MKEIKLTKGYVAIVDDEDYELVSKYKWYPMSRGNTVYARTNRGLLMHRLILGLVDYDGVKGIHLDDNGLHNWRSNLFAGDQALNIQLSDKVGKHKLKTTHCPKGHEYTGTNLYYTKEGWRQCKICRAAAVKAYQHKKNPRWWHKLEIKK